MADENLTGWVHLGNGLYTRVPTPDFASGLAFVNAIGVAAESAHHYPDVNLHRSHVDVAFVNRDAVGVHDKDVALARTISDLADDAGLTLDGASFSRINLALDTPATQDILPFWREFLAFEDRPGTDGIVRDPVGRMPTVWFQRSGRDEPRQRWHVDVWLDPSQVEARIDRCLAAGGRVVDDSHAPSFWVLADADGNRSCLATWQGRD